MRRKITNATLYFFTGLVLAVAVIAAAFFWRLSQGPVSLNFLKETVEQRINTSLDDVNVSIDDVIVERDETSGQPRIRLREVTFTDKQGRLIARAPRAAIGIRPRALLSGKVIPNRLELIGTRLLIQRHKDGSIGLGFSDAQTTGKPATSAKPLPRTRKPHAQPSGSGLQDAPANIQDVEFLSAQATSLLKILEGPDAKSTKQPSSWDLLNSVRISNTAITMYDEANKAVWFSPNASLVFRRTDYGFAVFVDGQIAGRENPWRVEMTAHYRKATRRFRVSSRVFDLVPAELAHNVFALSELTQVQLPLSGHVEAEFTRNGQVVSASAELTAAAGKVAFPAYISEPIIVDEGLLRLDLDATSGDIIIGNSAIFVGGSQAKLTGQISPVFQKNGDLTQLDIKLVAQNVRIDATGSVKNPAMFDKMSLDAVASIGKKRLIVNDLTLISGSSGLRVRGQFVGGEKAVGVFLSGRLRDLPTRTIKKLWPPIVARGARKWIYENVVSGLMDKGEFQIAIPADILAAAIDGQPIPEKLVNFRFSLKNIVTNYLDEMPTIKGASAQAKLSGDSFSLTMSGGGATLPGNKKVKLVAAAFDIRNLSSKVSPATLTVRASGKAHALLALVNHKPLYYLKKANANVAAARGDGEMTIKMKMPLARNMRRDEVKATATAKWTNGSFKQVIEGADLTQANMTFFVDANGLRAKGKARINGLASNISWQQSFSAAKGTPSTIVVTTTVTENERKELGMDVSRFIRGRVGLKVTAENRNGKNISTFVEANLSKAILALDEIDWVYPAGKKTKATFNVKRDKNTRQITNLKISGKNLDIRGKLIFNQKARLIKATFPKFRLDRYNDMTLSLDRHKKPGVLKVAGKAFDARSLINQAFSVRGTRNSRESGKNDGDDGGDMKVFVKLDNVVANRGELIKQVHGTLLTHKGKIVRADLQGQFVGGSLVSLQSSLDKSGKGVMLFTSRDAGAALRAANLYSKISGGTLSLKAILKGGPNGGIKKGLLVIRDFIIRDNKTLSAIQTRAKRSGKRKTGPRRSGQKFKRLTLPFSTDRHFVRIGDALIRGSEIGASANGRIRKSDGAMDIGGTIIPAYEINAALSGVPLLGTLLTGGKGEGVFGLNYALQGTMSRPKFIVNPVSAIAPGFLRKLFSIGGGGNVGSDGTGTKKSRKLNESER